MKDLKVGIIGNEGNWHSQMLRQAWRQRDIDPIFLDVVRLKASLGRCKRIVAGEVELNGLDLVMICSVPGGSLEQVIYRMDALHQLEDQGVRLVNRPGAIEKMVDKYYTLSLLQEAGLRVPETIVTENLEEASSAFEQLGGDVVIKPLFGSSGIGMVRVTEPEIARRILYAMHMNGFVFYLQQFIPHYDADIRVLVLNGACIAAMKRVADTWKTNISQGARPEKYSLEEDVRLASLASAEALGADFCGVDLMRGEDGLLYVIEVNSMPAWQGLQQVTEDDVAHRIVDGCLAILDHTP
jgi:RimK family alpha-L-glutamate ligase